MLSFVERFTKPLSIKPKQTTLKFKKLKIIPNTGG